MSDPTTKSSMPAGIFISSAVFLLAGVALAVASRYSVGEIRGISGLFPLFIAVSLGLWLRQVWARKLGAVLILFGYLACGSLLIDPMTIGQETFFGKFLIILAAVGALTLLYGLMNTHAATAYLAGRKKPTAPD